MSEQTCRCGRFAGHTLAEPNYCPDCGDRLNLDGSVTPMVPAAPAEAVRETWLWVLLGQIDDGNFSGTFMREAADSLFLINSDGTPSQQHATLVSALSSTADAADLRAAVADYMTCECCECPLDANECGSDRAQDECEKLVAEWLDNLLANYRASHAGGASNE